MHFLVHRWNKYGIFLDAHSGPQWNPMPPASMENHLVHEYIKNSLAPALWVGYNSSWMI